MKSRLFAGIVIFPMLLSCEKDTPVEDDITTNGFSSFSTNGQTLPTAIHSAEREIRFEIDYNVDPSVLMPEFTVPEGCTVHLNGQEQVSGKSVVDFTEPVEYLLKDQYSNTATWKVTAVPLSRKILIDATHDGGVWWYPQYEYTGFNQDNPHQGQNFANFLRNKGFRVDELGRGKELNPEMFFGYYIIIRVNGFQPYSTNELEVYTKLLKRGMNLVFFTDHKKYDPVDELGDHLGLQFKGSANGIIKDFKPHIITANMTSLQYIAGSVLTGYENNNNIEILGKLDKTVYADMNFNGVQDPGEPFGSPVMGILRSEKSKIFFIGDTNGLLVMPQPFINNLIEWMGHCFDDTEMP